MSNKPNKNKNQTIKSKVRRVGNAGKMTYGVEFAVSGAVPVRFWCGSGAVLTERGGGGLGLFN